MEGITLAIKYVLFYGLEAIVVAVVVVVAVTAGVVLYQFLRGRIRAIRKGPFPQHRSPFPLVTPDDRKN